MRRPSKLQFKDEGQGKSTSGRIGPKSDPPTPPRKKSRRQMLFEEETPQSEALPPDKKKRQRQFQTEDTPDSVASTTHTTTPDTAPDTSGQFDPKSETSRKYKQGEARSRPSERLRHDEVPPPNDGAPTAAESHKQKTKKKMLQEQAKLEKSKFRMEKSGAKLDKAQDKLAAQKPYKRPGPIKELGSAAKFRTWRYVHRKIHEVEHENVGVESAHKSELAGETAARRSARFVKHRFRTRPARRVRKLERKSIRARADYAFRDLQRKHPELKRNPLARYWQKRQIKKRYQRQAYKAAKQGAKTTKGLALVSKKIAGFAAMMVKGNPKVLLFGLCLFLLIVIVQSCMSLVVTIGNSTVGVVVGTSYLAEDADIDDAALIYSRWEAELQVRIQGIEQEFPGYDEYRYSVDMISHNPFELMAYLTAAHNDFTFPEIEGVLRELFHTQYTFSLVSETETRTRQENRVDAQGNPYTVTVQYEWRILNINLTSQSFTGVVFDRMDAEQLDRFRLLMITKGNRQHTGSPFPFNWLPFVSSHYGYRIHPIHGDMRRHWGIDIGLPTGTEILATQDATVTFAGNAGGYGLLVVLDNGAGLVTRYAHCSALLVSVGQTVEMGDVIALVGSTGDSTGPHLHYEIIKNGRHLNPLFFAVTNHHLAWSGGGIAGSAMTAEQFAALYAEARRHLGTPYRYGANGPHAFDCSSFVAWVFRHSGVYPLQRTTAQGIYNQTAPVPWGMHQPGDIIFFHSTYSTTDFITHIGIYVGGGRMIHAGSPVQYANINTPFWQRHFAGFGRLPW